VAHLLGGAQEMMPRRRPQTADFLNEWGIDPQNETRGGLQVNGANSATTPDGAAAEVEASEAVPSRTLYLLQRKGGKHGAGLGKTTGWIHRANLKKYGVQMMGNVSYVRVDGEGLHLKHNKTGEASVLPVDHVIVCAGQVSDVSLEAPLRARGIPTYKIGGAHLAAELDAKRAIDQATRLAVAIEDAKPEKVGEYVAPDTMSSWLFQKVAAKSA